MECTHSPARTTLAPGSRTRIAGGRRGFTLTELLVVITIMAILASLTAVGVMRALDTAKQTRIKVEVDNLDAAFKAYKEKYGSYPPCDLSQPDQIKAHVARAFPRYYDISQAPADVALVVDTGAIRPDLSLVFWLNGFNPDPTHPFLNLSSLTKAQRTPPLFDFDASRLVKLGSTTLGLSYVPAGVKNLTPYVYFDSGSYRTPTTMSFFWCNTGFTQSDAGYAMYYMKDVNGNGVWDFGVDEWVNPDSFQIISCGLDGKYGNDKKAGDPVDMTVRLYPTGNPYNPVVNPPAGYDRFGTDDDNITNFCERARLGDAKP